MSEHDEQCKVIEYCDFANIPIFAIPNGIYLKDRTTATRIMAKMKKEGLKKGVPDLFIPVAKGAFHGMFIEMKWGKNKPSPDQKKWINKLIDQGYCVVVCWSAEEAISHIRVYYDM